MADNEIVVSPQQITELRAISSETINEMADKVLEVAHEQNRTNEALEDFSASLYELKKAKDTYDKMAPTVKKQIRDLATRL